MFARTVAAVVVAGLAGLSTVAGLAQERERGHESARGPSAAPMQGPAAAPPAGMEQSPRERPPASREGQAGERAGTGMAPAPRGPGPGVGNAPGLAPHAPGSGQRPMVQTPAPAPAPMPGRPMPRQPGGEAEFGHRPMGQPPAVGQRPQNGHEPGAAQPFGHRPDAGAREPLRQAPRAYGRVPAPYRGDIHRFVDLDARVWHGGRWRHDHHRGRYGWWWVVGGLWYFYPQPVYPYPDPFAPGDVIYESGGAGDYWYYCESAGQYYPYVTECPEGWQAVMPEDQ
jgi:hypothetical protein